MQSLRHLPHITVQASHSSRPWQSLGQHVGPYRSEGLAKYKQKKGVKEWVFQWSLQLHSNEMWDSRLLAYSKYIPSNIWDILILKCHLLCVQSSHVRGCPVFYLSTHASAPEFFCLVKIQVGGSKQRGCCLRPSALLGCLNSLFHWFRKLLVCAQSLDSEIN